MIQNICLPERAATSFDLGDLSAEDRKTVEDATANIKSRYKQVIDDSLEIGKHLCEVKGVLWHGQFGAWLAAEFSWTQRTAQNLMSVWLVFGDKSEIVSHLPQTTLYALASRSTPASVRSEVVEHLERGGLIQPDDIKKMITTAKQEQKKLADGTKSVDLEPDKPGATQRPGLEALDGDSEPLGRASPEVEQEVESALRLLKKRLGDDFPAFLRMADMRHVGRRLQEMAAELQ